MLKVDDIVKMNPFRIKQASEEYSSDKFNGERRVRLVGNKKNTGEIDGANWWRREDLLIKGVDYT